MRETESSRRKKKKRNRWCGVGMYPCGWAITLTARSLPNSHKHEFSLHIARSLFRKRHAQFPKRNARNFAFSVSFYFFCSPKFCRFQREIDSFFCSSSLFRKREEKEDEFGAQNATPSFPIFFQPLLLQHKGGQSPPSPKKLFQDGPKLGFSINFVQDAAAFSPQACLEG